ncbi:uncharacterized protein [Temnothorax longispinosus]|uniref:uncharacterized protein isoform X2 n=1 Tax=Temnothorax longispinosus TaxID=300112 RepID=UPI003A99A3A1
MSERRPYRRNAQKKFIKELVRQSRIEANLADLRRRITTVYKAETSSDDNEEIHMLSISEINNEDIPSETNSSELSEGSEFVVVKFLSTDNDKDEYYEVALSKWLQDLDENMIGSILWPGDNSTAGMLVRTQVNAQSNWSIYAVEVKRYYDTYLHARKGLAEVIEYASAYETDTGKEMGRGKRKKKKNPITSSSESDNDQHLENQVKKKKPSIPSPPAIHVPEASTSVDKISSHKGKRNIIEDSSNIKESKVARHLGKPISSENNRQKLIEKIISERKKTMEKAEEKNNAMLRSVSSKVLQSSSQKQSKLSTSFSKHFVKSSPKKILSKAKTREKVKSSKNSTSSEVSLQASSCASENQFTPEKETSIVSPSKVYNILRKSDDSPRNPQKSPSFSSEKVDTSLSAQEKHSPLSSKKKLDLSVRNLSNFFSAAEKTLEDNRKELEGISSKLEVVIMNQTNLNRSLLPEQAVINRPSNLPSLPLSDIKSLEEFEKFLSNDVNLSAASYYLKSLALGNNEKTATSKLMTQLMTNSLAVHFNFDGHNPQKAMTVKRSFKQLKLWELFQGVMLLKFPDSDLSEALNTLRSWLRNAAGRKKD